MIHVSEEKLAANRANAQKSTGPTTPSGKAVSRMNRLRHGLYAEDVIVPQLNESKEFWEEFRQIYLDELNPKSLIQYTLAEQYIYDQWRLLRYRRFETGFAETKKAALVTKNGRGRPETHQQYQTSYYSSPLRRKQSVPKCGTLHLNPAA